MLDSEWIIYVIPIYLFVKHKRYIFEKNLYY